MSSHVLFGSKSYIATDSLWRQRLELLLGTHRRVCRAVVGDRQTGKRELVLRVVWWVLVVPTRSDKCTLCSLATANCTVICPINYGISRIGFWKGAETESPQGKFIARAVGPLNPQPVGWYPT